MWTPFNFFIGTWQGTGTGQPGTSQVERTYEFVLSGKFLQVRNKSTYLPQEQNPKGEVHEDWASSVTIKPGKRLSSGSSMAKALSINTCWTAKPASRLMGRR